MPTTPHFSTEFPTDSLIAAFVGRFPSASTRRNYRANLTDWFAWLAVAGVEPAAVGRGHVEAYTRHMERACHAPNTIYQHQSTVSSFSRWAVQEGHLVANPVDGVQRPRRSGESSANGPPGLQVVWRSLASRLTSAFRCTSLQPISYSRAAQPSTTSTRIPYSCSHRRRIRTSSRPTTATASKSPSPPQPRRTRSRPTMS